MADKKADGISRSRTSKYDSNKYDNSFEKGWDISAQEGRHQNLQSDAKSPTLISEESKTYREKGPFNSRLRPGIRIWIEAQHISQPLAV